VLKYQLIPKRTAGEKGFK